MTTLQDIDTTVQELRLERHRGAFTTKLAQIVTALDDQDVQQHLAGTIYELQRRLEAINVRFVHGARRP